MILIVCITYLIVLILLIGCIRLLVLLVILEVLSWLFVIIIPNSSTLNYLIVQSYFLVMSLCSSLFFPSILIVRFLLKLGIPPFHIWFIRIAAVVNKIIFSFIITVHKLVPILFLRKILLSFVPFSLLFLRISLTGIALIRRRTLFFTLVFSSMVHTIWMRFSLFLRKSFVLLYWFIYRLLFTVLVRLLSFMKIEQSYLSQSYLLSKCWLLLSGIPPFMIFWFKVYLLFWLISSIGFFMRVFVMFIRVFALTAYYRTWHFGSLLEYSSIIEISIRPVLMVLMFW